MNKQYLWVIEVKRSSESTWKTTDSAYLVKAEAEKDARNSGEDTVWPEFGDFLPQYRVRKYTPEK